MSKKTAKDVMLPHSEAKVAFYKSYLERYLSIMSVMEKCNRVNIYDVFCGRGVYEDGGLGSPIKAMETIKQVRQNRPSDTIFHLYLNDKVMKNVDGVQDYIKSHFNDNLCQVHYFCQPAEILLEDLPSEMMLQEKSTRNLVFIDPYGYKQIHKKTLYTLLSNNRTEVLLFLPISFMHRFTRYAFTENDKKAQPLKEFISEFFDSNSPICKDEAMDVEEYIKLLAQAFSFGKRFYSTRFLIQRDRKNYFALFFMTSNLLGLEKAVESLWELDNWNGKGFILEEDKNMPRIFDEQIFIDNKHRENIEKLKTIILSALQERARSNCEIYELTLINGFKPTHAREALTLLEQQNIIDVKKFGGAERRKGAFYINYGQAKDSMFPTIRIQLL